MAQDGTENAEASGDGSREEAVAAHPDIESALIEVSAFPTSVAVSIRLLLLLLIRHTITGFLKAVVGIAI